MEKAFENIINYLKQDDFKTFETELKQYILDKDKYTSEQRAEYYVTLRKALEDKFIENDDVKDKYTQIFRYTIMFLNKKDYDTLKFWSITAKHFEKFQMLDVAVKCYLEYAKFENSDKRVYGDIAEILFKYKHDDVQALKYYKKFTEYFHDNAYVYNMAGHLTEKIYKSEHLDEQFYYFEKAHALQPKVRSFIKNLALIAGKNKDVGRFCKYSGMLLKTNPKKQELFDYGCWSLYNKIFKNFYKYYQYRFYKEEGATEYPNVDDRLWNGIDDIKGKKLIIRREQGYGDSITYVRFLPLIKKLVPNFTFIDRDPLVSFLQYNYPDIDIVDDKKDLKDLDFDYQIPMMNLLSVLKITDKNMPFKDGYLKADNKLADAFKKKYINPQKFNIAIAFKGCQTYNGDNRDMPEETWLKLTKLPNVQIYSVQVDAKERMFQFKESQKIIDLSNELTDFEKTAAVLKNMDLIVSTDNVVLNLAGAMGLKTFGIFNYYSDFRWFTLKGNDTGWYDSIKVYRVKKYNAWNELFDMVINDVQKLADEKTKK
ncbi:MAG: hypothetical protein K6C94_08155 [Candidatus Gastranaerophilales bacterium]|nr:hypothetical protein [Candidatus Gastranaerophilales bacterium]